PVLLRPPTPPDDFRSTGCGARCGHSPCRRHGRSGCKTRRWELQRGTHNSSGNLPELFDSRLNLSYKWGPVIGPYRLVVGAVHEALRSVVNCRRIPYIRGPVGTAAGETYSST